CRFCDVSESQAFVAIGSDSILVAFRGTESKVEDWVTDSRCKLVRGPLAGHVHAGFYDSLSHIWRDLNRWVAEATRHRDKAIWVTGHSLGAALATLAVARWVEEGKKISGLYTFGQPRAGDETFARNFNFLFKPSAFRFVNNSDFVTRVPPRSLGYSHTGTFRYFPGPGELKHEISWWNRFLDQWPGTVGDLLGWMS